MITVLHLTSSFGLGGGAEINLSRLVCRMDRSRFRNVVVTMTEGVGYNSLQAALVRANVPVYSLGMRRGVPNRLGATRLLRIIRPTAVDSPNLMYHADLLGLLVGYPARVPLIAWNIQCSALPMAHHGWMTDRYGAFWQHCHRFRTLNLQTHSRVFGFTDIWATDHVDGCICRTAWM